MKPGTLRVWWSKRERDVMLENGPGCNRADASLLQSVLCCERRIGREEWVPSLVAELKARGYDVTTLKFSIKKLAIPQEGGQQ